MCWKIVHVAIYLCRAILYVLMKSAFTRSTNRLSAGTMIISIMLTFRCVLGMESLGPMLSGYLRGNQVCWSLLLIVGLIDEYSFGLPVAAYFSRIGDC